MASTKEDGTQLEGDITFIKTPPAKPSKFAVEDCGVKITKVSPQLHPSSNCTSPSNCIPPSPSHRHPFC